MTGMSRPSLCRTRTVFDEGPQTTGWPSTQNLKKKCMTYGRNVLEDMIAIYVEHKLEKVPGWGLAYTQGQHHHQR